MPAVSVPQEDGAIVVAYDGDPSSAKTYHVKDGQVQVAAEHLPAFLQVVAGSKPARKRPDPTP